MSRVAKVLLACAALLAPVLAWLALRHRHVQAAPSEADAAWDRLAAFESLRRSKADFAKARTWDELSGPDPYAIQRLPGSSELVGILRGSDAVVVLDPSLKEVARLDAPAGPVALAVGDGGTVWVAGELATKIARYRWKDGRLTADGAFELEDVRAIRGLATGSSGLLYAIEEHRGRLLAFRVERAKGAERIKLAGQLEIGNGPFRLERVGDVLVADCLLDHALVFVKLDARGGLPSEPLLRIVQDGPIWSFSAQASQDGKLVVAAGAVEDHPLDRTIGAFGYVDSFVYLYDVDLESRTAKRTAAVNVSELGVVTPKAIALETSPSIVVTATGYGSDKLVRLQFAHGKPMRAMPFVPGTTAVTRLSDGTLAFADPLLDAWVKEPGQEVVPVASDKPRSDTTERVGEALFFTTLMAPWNRSDGPLSRFTCETCHFEGYVDGRTHHTGRGDVRAVTKPLLGLWNNRPHFSRALDSDLVEVAFNEFRVAGAKSDHDPWFALRASDAPWLAWLGSREGTLGPETLRQSLISFLMAFNHRPNPMVLGRTHFTDDEKAGALVFRDRCESCHEARVASDAPVSRVPFDRWEGLVMSREGPIVWGKAEYAKTGIEPYVHEKGARVPSLRRLYKKHPYFTNGSAKDLDEVLRRARFLPDGFRHAPAASDEGATLDERSRAALLSFLDLL